VVERAREALAEQHRIALQLGGHAAIGEDVGEIELAARLQTRKISRKDPRLVGREIHHAVRHDDVDARVGDASAARSSM
jgi:hypothetical protein